MLEQGFYATRTSAQTGISTGAKIEYNIERWDIGGCYDNATNFRFQPLVQGIYNVGAILSFNSLADGQNGAILLYKNGSPFKILSKMTNGGNLEVTLNGTTEVTMNGTTDYLEIFIEFSGGGTMDTLTEEGMGFWASRIRRDES